MAPHHANASVPALALRGKSIFLPLHAVLKNAVSVPEPAPLPSLRAGALDFHTTASMEDHKCLDSVLYRLSERIKLRRIQMKPAFQDFDW